MKYAQAPALSAPGGSQRSDATDGQAPPSGGRISRRQADLGAEGPSVSDELMAAWRSNARCAECGQAVAAASDAALLVGPNRVVHRDRCFVPALLRAHPLLKLLAARSPAQEVTITPPAVDRSRELPASRAAPRESGGRDA